MTIAMPLKYLRSFWRSLDIPLINCKVELKLQWTKFFVLSEAGADNVNYRDSNNIILTIKDTKLYAPVVTLSARDNQEPSKLLTLGSSIHPLSNIKINNYFKYEPGFNSVFSRNNLLRINDGTYVINLDDKNSERANWVSLFIE